MTTISQTTIMSGACEAESDPPGIFSFRSVYDAYVAGRKRKRNTINSLKFEVDILDNLYTLSEELAKGSYEPSRAICFIVKQPKYREIFAADFRDRVIHHLLVPSLEKVFEPIFIHDSYACRRGKGTHAAVQRLRYFMNKITRGGRTPAWFMQLDIRSFFMSIDKGILLNIINRRIKDININGLRRKLFIMIVLESIYTKVIPNCRKGFLHINRCFMYPQIRVCR